MRVKQVRCFAGLHEDPRQLRVVGAGDPWLPSKFVQVGRGHLCARCRAWVKFHNAAIVRDIARTLCVWPTAREVMEVLQADGEHVDRMQVRKALDGAVEIGLMVRCRDDDAHARPYVYGESEVENAS